MLVILLTIYLVLKIEKGTTGDDTNIDLKLTPKGTGKLNLDGIKFPNTDGSAGQFLQTDGSGVLSFATPSSGANTPYFQAKITSDQSPSNNVATKVNYDNEILDSGGYYNTSDKRFTPLVAGKYMIHAEALLSSDGASNLTKGIFSIYKNGSVVNTSDSFFANSFPDSVSFHVQAIVSLNGSSDYVEIFATIQTQNGSGMKIVSTSTRSVFEGFKLIE